MYALILYDIMKAVPIGGGTDALYAYTSHHKAFVQKGDGLYSYRFAAVFYLCASVCVCVCVLY